jgi:hypothetical protein
MSRWIYGYRGSLLVVMLAVIGHCQSPRTVEGSVMRLQPPEP